MQRTLGWLSAFLACALVAPAARAHINLKSPKKRAGGDIKIGPCTNVPRGASPTVLEPGATITVSWDETIQHPGHYRIAFDVDGEDFPVPASYDDVKASLPFDAGNGVTILADDIMDMMGPFIGNTPYEATVTLPDVECETCTLQVIQMMTEKTPYGDGNDIYFECADLVLRRTGGTPDAGMVLPPPDAGLPPPTTGGMGAPPPPVAGMGAVAGTGVTTGGATSPLPPATAAGSGSGDGGSCSVGRSYTARRSGAPLALLALLALGLRPAQRQLDRGRTRRRGAIASAPGGRTAGIAELFRGFFRGRKPRTRPQPIELSLRGP